MKSQFITLTATMVVLTGILFLTSCSENNLGKVAPTAPAALSLRQQHIAAASPFDVAILARRFNDNSGRFAPAKSSSAQRIAASSVTTPIYAVTDLGTLGGEFSAALDINASGQIVGAATIVNGDLHPFLYENGHMTDLGILGGTTGSATGINEVGEIIGQTDNVQGIRRAFLYRNGVMSDLGTLGGSESRGNDINASSQIVGSASTSAGARHAFLYENGQMFDLGTLGGTTRRAEPCFSSHPGSFSGN